MSTKKNKFNHKDHYYMNLAFNLARDKAGLTGSNPPVGCVIVKNDEVISIGQTGKNGRPHAEYNAIKSCKENLKGSKMYISLEPCTHYGKTSPLPLPRSWCHIPGVPQHHPAAVCCRGASCHLRACRNSQHRSFRHSVLSRRHRCE